MKATIRNLRALNAGLEKKGVSIPLHECAKLNGKWYKGNAPIRAWGKTVGTGTEILKSMLDTYKILQLELPEVPV